MVGRSVTAGTIGLLAVVLLLAAGGPRPVEAASVSVTSTADSGPGSFRQAVLDANANASINSIVLKNWLPITLTSPVVYTGQQALTIRSDSLVYSRVIRGPSACDLLQSTMGADLTLERVTFQESDCAGVLVLGGNGFGDIVVTLNGATMRNNRDSGLKLTEDMLYDSSFTVNATLSRFTDNGRAGLEIFEWGDGDVRASVSGSSFDRNTGRGLEIDEGDTGMLTVEATSSSFNGFGGGLQATEAGTGDLNATLKAVQANDSAGPRVRGGGIWLVEVNEGHLRVTAAGVVTNRNNVSGLSATETGEGDLIASLVSLQAWDNNSSGVLLREFDGGSADVSLSSSVAGENVEGFDFEEYDEGDLAVTSFGSNATRNQWGFWLEEQGSGAFDADFAVTTTPANTVGGVHAAASGDPGTLDRSASPLLGPIVAVNVNVTP